MKNKFLVASVFIMLFFGAATPAHADRLCHGFGCFSIFGTAVLLYFILPISVLILAFSSIKKLLRPGKKDKRTNEKRAKGDAFLIFLLLALFLFFFLFNFIILNP